MTCLATKNVALIAVLLAGVAWAQSQEVKSDQSSNSHRGQVTVRGCVAVYHGNYALIQQDPGNTYNLQSSGKIKLEPFLGKTVEITGNESTSIRNSTGFASPVTITVQSIKTISRECHSE